MTFEDGTDRLYRNDGKELILYSAKYPEERRKNSIICYCIYIHKKHTYMFRD